MKIKKKITKFGSSLGVILPAAILEALGYKQGDEIVIEIKEKEDKNDGKEKNCN